MVFCGIDWAEDHHDVCLVDEAGDVLWRRRVDHDPTGIAELRLAIEQHEGDPGKVLVAIETGRGLLVAALVEAGYTVYPVNPKAAERYRDRRKPSGGKNDRLDAAVLADALRTDRASLRPLLADSELGREIATLARDHAALVREHTRLRHKLRSALLEYFPAALAAFTLDADSTLRFLERYPTPEPAATRSPAQLERFLKAQGANRNAGAKGEVAVAALRAPALRAAPEVARAKARLVEALCTQLLALRPTLAEYERELGRLLKTHPEGDILLSSLPGLGTPSPPGCWPAAATTRSASPARPDCARTPGRRPLSSRAASERW